MFMDLMSSCLAGMGWKVDASQPHRVRGALYGYRRAQQLWHQNLTRVLVDRLQSKLDPTFFFDVDRMVFMIVYVDDMLLLAPTAGRKELQQFLSKEVSMRVELELKKVGDEGWLLGRRIRRIADGFELQ
jgi:hypothetical protein